MADVGIDVDVDDIGRAVVGQPHVAAPVVPQVEQGVAPLRHLEDALLGFAGCAVVVSHDRWFLDRIATHILAFEGDSHVEFFQGNYREYEEDKKRRMGDDAAPKRLRFKALK